MVEPFPGLFCLLKSSSSKFCLLSKLIKMVFSPFLRLVPRFSLKRLLLSDLGEVKMAPRNLVSEMEFSTDTSSLSKFKPVTHVIFDMDGLLLDTECIYKNIITEIVESYGKKYTKEIQLKVLGTTEQSTARILVRECGLPLTVDEFLVKFREMQDAQLGDVKLMKGAERLVCHLYNNSIPIAVATSSGHKSVAKKIKNHQKLFEMFSHLVMGSSDPEVKEGKPAPDIFMVCAKRFHDKPDYEKCLVFEDAPNGATGAIKANMQVVMVPDTVIPPEKTRQATLVIESLLDFKPEDFGLPPFKD